MRQNVFLHIQETYDYRNGPRQHQILAQGVLIREENLIRLEYQVAMTPASGMKNASIMKADSIWHITRPSFSPDLVTLCPGQVCHNTYGGEKTYELDTLPTELRWEDGEKGGEVICACRISRSGMPYRSYNLRVRYTTMS